MTAEMPERKKTREELEREAGETIDVGPVQYEDPLGRTVWPPRNETKDVKPGEHK